jgi:hypothetical protein
MELSTILSYKNHGYPNSHIYETYLRNIEQGMLETIVFPYIDNEFCMVNWPMFLKNIRFINVHLAIAKENMSPCIFECFQSHVTLWRYCMNFMYDGCHNHFLRKMLCIWLGKSYNSRERLFLKMDR